MDDLAVSSRQLDLMLGSLHSENSAGFHLKKSKKTPAPILPDSVYFAQ